MNKKRWSRLLGAVMALCALNGCGSPAAASSAPQESGSGASAAGDASEEPVSLKFFVGRHPTHSDWNEMLVWKTYEEISGVHVDFEQIEESSLSETLNVRLASGNLPDAFYRCKISSSDLVTYGGKGLFVELGSLIPGNAPNIQEMFERMPEVKKTWTQPDGKIYATSNVVGADLISLTVPLRYWVKSEWLERTGKTMPATTEEYYELLKAVKAADPEIIPYTSHSFKWILRSMKGAFGIGNRGIEHEYVDYDESAGKLRFFANTENWKEMLQYLNKLYSEELLDQDIFTKDFTQYVAEGGADKFATFVGIGPAVLGFEDAHGYEGTMLLKGPHGDDFTAMVQPAANGLGNFVITSANKYPEQTLQWVDYFYGQEGSQLYFMGVEGETFTVDGQGIPRYIDDILHNPDGLSLDQSVGRYLCWPGGYYPAVVYQKFFMAAEGKPEVLEACEAAKDHRPSEIWSAFTFTPQENNEFVALRSDIEKYVSECAAQFVAGELSFDQWDKYTAELDKMDLARYMEIYDAAYQRYANS